MKKPFTLQYAKEQVNSEFWANPDFIRANYIITLVWAAAFALMVVAEAAILFIPSVPQKIGVWVAILVIYAAFRFTVVYSNHRHTTA